ncbi:MAG: TVP38/TMEM64 family protein [Phycisphaerales bacterium]|nr:TVP38/TMEM64 family protein [Phycisphaerales bacterium]MCB9840542.1 TVP38/TMEM64 family protein [Phycisphaeraceae bacterium]
MNDAAPSDNTNQNNADAPPDATTPAPDADPATEPHETIASVARKLGPVTFLAAFAAFMPAIAGIALLSTLNPVGDWFKSHDDLGVLLYVIAFMLLAGLAFLPTYSQAVLGGWAFGFAIGFPAALAGFFGGSIIGYTLANSIGGDRGDRLINEHPKWSAVRDTLVGGKEGVGVFRTIGIVALLRLPPNSPFALTNLVMAAAKVPRMPFAIGTLVGMAPRTAAAVYIAGLIQGEFNRDAINEATPWWILPTGIVVTIVALGIVGLVANKAIHKVTGYRKGQPAPAPAAEA